MAKTSTERTAKQEAILRYGEANPPLGAKPLNKKLTVWIPVESDGQAVKDAARDLRLKAGTAVPRDYVI